MQSNVEIKVSLKGGEIEFTLSKEDLKELKNILDEVFPAPKVHTYPIYIEDYFAPWKRPRIWYSAGGSSNSIQCLAK